MINLLKLEYKDFFKKIEETLMSWPRFQENF
jgi:hypothetical protein